MNNENPSFGLDVRMREWRMDRQTYTFAHSRDDAKSPSFYVNYVKYQIKQHTTIDFYYNLLFFL
jgi:hypothetical protein